MHSNSFRLKSVFSLILISTLIFLITGCGLLGKKDAPVTPPGVIGGTGCLNQSKDLVSRYLKGEVSDVEWKSAFNCVNQSIDLFKDFVHGSTKNSYSQKDMLVLVTKFLITNKSVRPELMTGAFSLKAALLGGNQSEFTKDEIDLLKNSLNRLRDITVKLIPAFAVRREVNPSFTQLSQMITAFKLAGDQLGDFANTLPTGALSDKIVENLLSELVILLDIPSVQNLTQTLFLGKWVLFNSRRDGIESSDWSLVFKTALGIGGIALAYQTAVGEDPSSPKHAILNRIQNEYRFREFMWSLAEAVRPYLDVMLVKHGGATPFPLFEQLIDELPTSVLNEFPKSTLKKALRPLVRKLLFSSSNIGLDRAAIQTAYGLLEEFVKDFGLVDRLYEKSGLDIYSVKIDQFTQALDDYYSTLDGNDQVRFQIIKEKLLMYKPLFYKDTSRIRYEAGIGYNKFQQIIVLTLDRIGRHLLKAYGDHPDYFVDEDLDKFFHEFQEALFAIKVVDPTIPNFWPSRRQDMDLFTPLSDGNGQASIPELVNYGMILISSAGLTSDMRREITGVCDSGLGTDIMGWTKIPADCFRREFNNRLEYWTSEFPRLQNYWKTLSPDQQTRAMKWLEHGARRNGYTEADFDKYDMGSLSTVLHYTESLFTRFDFNDDETLGKSEIEDAYPVFKLLLAKKAKQNPKNDYLIKGVFTYIVKFRAMPETSSIGGISKFAYWLAIYSWRTTHYNADRVGVFNIVCQLAAPESSSQLEATKTICKQ